MGMDLSGAGGYFRWSGTGWGDILALGEEYGWVPAGTGPPPGVLKADWPNGTYYSNDGQRFYARDARALADALERALAAPPAAAPPRTRPAQSVDHVVAALTGKNRPKKGRVPVGRFNPDEAGYIREFIEFCRAGSIRIH